jgi:hypothetical protein
MRLYIPAVGDELVLARDWNFTLHEEHRNESLGKGLGLVTTPRSHRSYYSNWDGSTIPRYQVNVTRKHPVSLPTGTVLRVERVYIRAGSSEEFNSLTFRVLDSPNATLKKARFWAKLKDVNQMDVVGSSNEVLAATNS